MVIKKKHQNQKTQKSSEGSRQEGWGGGEGSLVSSFDLVNSMIQSFDLDDLLIENECSNNRATFISDEFVELLMLIREPFKNYLAIFFR